MVRQFLPVPWRCSKGQSWGSWSQSTAGTKRQRLTAYERPRHRREKRSGAGDAGRRVRLNVHTCRERLDMARPNAGGAALATAMDFHGGRGNEGRFTRWQRHPTDDCAPDGSDAYQEASSDVQNTGAAHERRDSQKTAGQLRSMATSGLFCAMNAYADSE
ncbi:hypothetical protein CERSUDRAFT_115124 [Gelatoporia subvermispora B]|uniref:Uncharacterized protein n=1 Tax=Ceriporiopsis subvermispora (strain B) TaxID=914234 RepID=M2QGH7_CERS8|nr:hypothetical protein CERSUDRAFT_115124 [Gelatoporia subvermispora B]